MAREPFNPQRARGGAGPKSARSSAASEAPSASTRMVTVVELTRWITRALEEALPATLHVAGELSNVKRHSSGHLYFSLKDEHSEVACVMWRSDAIKLKFELREGLGAVVVGNIGVYERSGRYQLYARRIEPRGVGALELAFRQLCERLQAEGLFETARKRTLPPYPRRIGVITSPSGAALHDITDTLRRRYPVAEIVFCPVAVQGEGAAASIAAAIATLNRKAASLGGIDVLIAGRGGGSMEDLWAFNEEGVARALFASTIPTVSAVGHETDMTVADLVADVRAATPTAAAELVTPHWRELDEDLAQRGQALAAHMRHLLRFEQTRLAGLVRTRAFAAPREWLATRGQPVTALTQQSTASLLARVSREQRRREHLAACVERLRPATNLAQARQRVDQRFNRLAAAIQSASRRAEQAAGRTRERLLRHQPGQQLALRRAWLVALQQRLATAVTARQQRMSSLLEAVAGRLRAMSYHGTLARGYSLTRDARTGRLLRSAGQVKEGDRLRTELADGSLTSRVLDTEQGELFE